MPPQSPAPGTDQTADKAWVATAVAFVGIVVSAWIADDGIATAKEVASWLLSGLVGSGLAGGAAWYVPNRLKR